MLLDIQIWETITETKKAGKIFLPVGTTMIRYLESLPYIWKFLKKKNLTPPIDPTTKDRRDQLTATIDETLVDEFIPEQEISDLKNIIAIKTRLFIRP